MLYVRDLMTANPITVAPTTSLREVLSLMKRYNCRQVPVIEDGQLTGIITDRDIRLAIESPLAGAHWQHHDPAAELTVAECMTPNPLTVTPDTSIYKVAEILGVYKFGAIPVVWEQGKKILKLAGIVTVTDLLRQLASCGAGLPESDPVEDYVS